MSHKNTPIEEKLHELVNQIYNPFVKPNFNKSQIAFSENTELDREKQQPRPDPTEAPSVARSQFPGAPLKPEV